MLFLTQSSVLCTVFLFAFSGNNLFAAEIHAAVASNFLLPAKYIANVYEHETGEKVVISAGSTGKLYAQIINGAPFDVFLAANQREPQRLEEDGYVITGSRFTYARGKLVLWDSKGLHQQDTFQEVLNATDFRRVAIANPLTAPYGAAALSVLKKLGLEEIIETKLVQGENVSQAYQYVATGAADLGFIAMSQLKANQDKQQGRYWLVSDDMHAPILQQAVLLKNSNHKMQAQKFLNYLKSSKGMEMIENFGYGII